MIKSIGDRIALVVPSCDTYADVWPPLLQALQRFWPANGFSKYLVTNHLLPSFPGVQTLAVGTDVSWSDNLLSGLERIPEDYVLINIDDLILCGPVDHEAVMSALSRLISAGGNYLRLNPTPAGSVAHDGIGIVPPGDIYRASTVFSVWRKDILHAVLRPRESAWHFEIHGSVRTDPFGAWFASNRFLLNYVNLVIKGKVDPRARTVLERRGITYHSPRRVLSHSELARRWMQEQRSRAFELIPRKLGRSIRNVFGPV